jgi:N5-(cytidine 5'-diphosphoramidyl)-L-glutamine hydrolase
MKIIGITQRVFNHHEYKETREALDVNWSKFIYELGFIPLIIPININPKEYFIHFKIDGLLLSGGNDTYSKSKNELSKKRDQFEFSVINYSLNNSLPILGVCRGMLLINEFFNGDIKKINNHVAANHSITSSRKSKYCTFIKSIKKVNSFHNYSINKLGDDLTISAVDDFENIEAIEHKKNKIFGQMWHPERKSPFEKEQNELIKYFFNS